MNPPVDRRRQFLSLGVALIIASGLGFVLIGIVGRWLPPDDNALFLSVWGVVFGFGSVLSATEQEISRQAAVARLAGRRAPTSVLQWAALGLAISSLGLAIVTFLMWDRIFAGSPGLVALTFTAALGFTGQFLTRGLFLGAGHTRGYAWVIVLEAFVRVVPAALLLAGGVHPRVVLAVASVVVGCWSWVVFSRRVVRSIEFWSGGQPWRQVAGRLGTLAGANALSSLVLTAFPTLVTAVIGSPAGLAVLFGVVTLSRVPLVLVSPLQAMMVPLAVDLLHAGRGRDLLTLQAKGAAALAVAAAILGGGGWALGPWAIRLFLGPQYEAGPAMVAIAVSMSAVMGLALLQAAVFIALERYALVGITWGSAVVGAVAALAWFPGEPATRGLAAFVVASLTGYLASGILLQRALRDASRTL